MMFKLSFCKDLFTGNKVKHGERIGGGFVPQLISRKSEVVRSSIPRTIFRVGVVMSILLFLAACGPSQAELDATETQAAEDDFSTQTAQAPTATLTPSLTPTSTPTPLPPTPVGGGSRIAFSSNRDGDYEIYIMSSDGSDQRRLTNSPGTDDWFPSLLPDGSVLLYWSYAEEPLTYNLNWALTDGSGQGVYIEVVGAYSDVSFDGYALVTMLMGEGNSEIGVVSLAGGDIIPITSDPAIDTMPRWAPDGKTIAFVSNRDGPNHIFLMDIDGRNLRRLTDNDWNELEPDWSPDGSMIVFTVVDVSNTSSIYLINADGTGLRLLVQEEGAYSEGPVWSPDGTMIAFWSNRTGNSEIYVINVDGSGLTNISNHPAADENPSWSQ